jgi:WASH complex subunit 7
VRPLRLAHTTVHIRTRVEDYLNATFHSHTALALHNWKTYGEMRKLAQEKYGIVLAEITLPGQTLEQGLDVLEVMRNIHLFVAKFHYNLHSQVGVVFPQAAQELSQRSPAKPTIWGTGGGDENEKLLTTPMVDRVCGDTALPVTDAISAGQVFIEAPLFATGKTLNTIGIRHVANSIRTHGMGIMNTAVNFAYQFLAKKFNTFSQFLYDDHIRSRLLNEVRYFAEHRVGLDNHYPIERAEKVRIQLAHSLTALGAPARRQKLTAPVRERFLPKRIHDHHLLLATSQ